MVLGFTFPFFWAYHAAGFADFLFWPLQVITSSESKIWPSFITTSILYVGTIVLIELISRPKKRTFTPELHNLHQPPQPDHESFSPGHYTEKVQDQRHHQELSSDQGESSPKTDQ